MKHDEATTLNLLSEVQSQLLDYEPTIKQSMIVDGQARYLRWDFSKQEFEKLSIIQITDVQFGHNRCNVKKFKSYIAWLLAEPSRFAVLGGDMLDAGHVQSKGSPFEQIGDPQDELWSFVKLMAPARHRILGYVGGNHERRTIPTFGDIGRSIATILKVPYSPGKQHLDIDFGSHRPFKISMWHGSGSGRTKGTIANTLERFMNQADSQLYLMGHLHQAMTIQESREVRNKKGQMEMVNIVGARGSSFLEHYGTYSEVVMGANPQKTLMPKLMLYSDGGWEVILKG